jgi:hypothetical protein
MHKRFLMAPAAIVLLAAYGAAAQQSQSAPPENPPAQTQTAPSLADAARKSREAKKSETKTGKVFTNDNLPSSAEVNVVGTEPAVDSTGAPVVPANRKLSLEQEEQSWRARFAMARAKLDRDQATLDILQREMSNLQLNYYPNDPMKQLQQSVTRSDIISQQNKIAKKQADVAADKTALSDLEDALRHAGGDPGWAR